MTQERKEELIAATLAWCNEQRRRKGMEPLEELPKGVRRDERSCPCGEATGLFVSMTRFCGSEQWPGIDFVAMGILPDRVSAFVSAFDNGEFPELERVGKLSNRAFYRA